MRPYIVYAVIAGLAWGIGGYLEKAGFRALRIPPIAGIALRTFVGEQQGAWRDCEPIGSSIHLKAK